MPEFVGEFRGSGWVLHPSSVATHRLEDDGDRLSCYKEQALRIATSSGQL